MISNGVIMFPNSMVSSSPRVAELQERVSALSTLRRYMTMTGTQNCFVIKTYSLRYLYFNSRMSSDGSIHVFMFVRLPDPRSIQSTLVRID